MKKLLAFASMITVAVALSGTASAQTMGIVVKVGGSPWFNAMDLGIQRKAAELGVTAEKMATIRTTLSGQRSFQ